VFHEAMMRKEDPDKPDNTILEEFQSGYMMGETILRPAKVIVNKLTNNVKSEENTNDQGNEEKKD